MLLFLFGFIAFAFASDKTAAQDGDDIEKYTYEFFHPSVHKKEKNRSL